MTDALLTVEGLHTHLPTAGGRVRAVDGVDFRVDRGETVCLVGESGSGKTLTCDSITGLVAHPNADVSGRVAFDGRDLLSAGESTMRSVRGDQIGYVFQNAQSALDPVYTIGEQIVEAISFHDAVTEGAGRQRAIDLLRTVGISRPERRVDQYPHEFSDGMCQRAAIAIALAAEPDLLIADEPTSAVDVTIQARIIDLLERIQAERDLSLLLVTHDLRVVSALADRVVILYDGRVVERGPLSRVFGSPGHPYTQALLRSFTGDGQRSDDSGNEPAPDGCPFRTECRHAVDACADGAPAFHAVGGATDHEAACVFHGPDRDPATVMADAPRLGDGPGGGADE